MARALALAAAALGLVLAQRGAARADARTAKVTIETEPPGAKVYFGLKEDGEVCTTPCTVDAPIGETAIIVEAENRRSIIENLIVRKRARPLRLSFKLEPAVGTLIVEGSTGATIKLDDQDVGKAPQRIENVPAGGHHVALEKNGKSIHDEFIEIEAGREATVAAPAVTAEPAPPASDAPEIAATARTGVSARRTPAIAVSGAIDVGFRQFTYNVPDTITRSRQEGDEREAGQVLAGPIVEIWPTTLLGLDTLPGLALYGRFAYGINPQAVPLNGENGMQTPTSLTTAWQSLEISVRHRWHVGRAGAIEVGGGYVEDRYRFTGKEEDLEIVPDASYQSVRIGARGSLRFGPIEPYAALENRVVFDGGPIEERYSLGTSANGVRGALGASARLGSFEIRVEGALTRYSWTFKPDTTDDTKAKSGQDVIENVLFALGYVR